MRNRTVLIGLLTGACGYIVDVPQKYLPEDSLDAAIVLSSRHLSHTGSEARVEVNIALFDRWGYFDLLAYRPSEFAVDGEGGEYEITDFSDDQRFESPANSSTVVLIDQSGDYSATDPYNYRSKGINKFMQDIAGSGRFLIGGFSSDGRLAAEPVEYVTADFTSDWEDQVPPLFDLAQRTGGECNVFEALGDAIAKVSAGSSGNRHIVALVHGDDNSGNDDVVEELVAEAISNNVKIHILVMGSADVAMLSYLSQATGGSFAHSINYRSLVTALGHLPRVIGGVITGYTLTVKAIPSSGSYVPGDIVRCTVTVTDAFSESTLDPLEIAVKLPQ